MILQAESVREAAWGCQWVGTSVPFVRSLSFIINMASKEIVLTAGKFVPVSKATLLNVSFTVDVFRTLGSANQNSCIRLSVCIYKTTRRMREGYLRNLTMKSVNIICICIEILDIIEQNCPISREKTYLKFVCQSKSSR